MRLAVVAALLTGLLAAVAAQKAVGPGSLGGLAMHVILPTQSTRGAVAASASQAAQTDATPAPAIGITQAVAPQARSRWG
jgi:hypothetical protein